MGNSPSIAELPPEWEDILPNVTREDILRSSRKKCRVDEDKSVYLDEDLFDLDEHVPMALAILRAHPHLKDVRFRLVPGRLMEEQWWAALFGILHDGGIEMDQVAGKIDDDYETGDEVDDSMEAGIDDENGAPLEYNADAGSTPPCYLEEIKAQQAHISSLRKSLREANHKIRKLAMELHKERKKRYDEGIGESNEDESTAKEHSGSVASCQKCNSSLAPKKPHKGEWEVHPDCAEFLKLDDHLKDNLRKEKEKRLNEVRSQMKFILDSDDVKDSYGKWQCCGKEEYLAEGCA